MPKRPTLEEVNSIEQIMELRRKTEAILPKNRYFKKDIGEEKKPEVYQLSKAVKTTQKENWKKELKK